MPDSFDYAPSSFHSYSHTSSSSARNNDDDNNHTEVIAAMANCDFAQNTPASYDDAIYPLDHKFLSESYPHDYSDPALGINCIRPLPSDPALFSVPSDVYPNDQLFYDHQFESSFNYDYSVPHRYYEFPPQPPLSPRSQPPSQPHPDSQSLPQLSGSLPDEHGAGLWPALDGATVRERAFSANDQSLYAHSAFDAFRPLHEQQPQQSAPPTRDQHRQSISEEQTEQSSSIAGSLDPTTGVFYRTTEHPRLRTAQACEKCRARKAKCSGDHPACGRCVQRGLICEYAPERRMRGPNRPKNRNSVSLATDSPPSSVSSVSSRRSSVVSLGSVDHYSNDPMMDGPQPSSSDPRRGHKTPSPTRLSMSLVPPAPSLAPPGHFDPNANIRMPKPKPRPPPLNLGPASNIFRREGVYSQNSTPAPRQESGVGFIYSMRPPPDVPTDATPPASNMSAGLNGISHIMGAADPMMHPAHAAPIRRRAHTLHNGGIARLSSSNMQLDPQFQQHMLTHGYAPPSRAPHQHIPSPMTPVLVDLRQDSHTPPHAYLEQRRMSFAAFPSYDPSAPMHNELFGEKFGHDPHQWAGNLPMLDPNDEYVGLNEMGNASISYPMEL